MKNFLLFALLMIFCDADVDVIEHYFNFQHRLNWFDAQKYCRENYMDLATISSEEEHQRLTENGRWGWVGLHRSNSMSWQWSDGEVTNFFRWSSVEPDNLDTEFCVEAGSSGWYNRLCSNTYYFNCQTKIFFVKENKTWDEALEYCSSKYTGLLSLNSDARLELAAVVTLPVYIVWTGLRFLDGKWIWLNGAQAGSLVSLPSCPVQTYRCGARNFNKNVWENRDCNEKLYFLCY